MKKEKGITLINLIFIIIIAIVILGGVTTIIVINFERIEQMKYDNNNLIQNSLITNNNNTLNNQLNIDEIKKKKYSSVFGKNGSQIYPPQSYIVNNIISINPNKDERFFVINAQEEIGITESSLFVYLYDEKEEVEIKLYYENPNNLVIQECINDTNIYVRKSNQFDVNDLKNIRYILLEDIPNIFSNSYYSNHKCYMILIPSFEIENEEIVKIANNIVIDETRGKFTVSGDSASIVANNEETTRKIGKYTFMFENVILNEWGVRGAGNNEITYTTKVNNEYVKTAVTLPRRIYAGKNYTISDIEKEVEYNNSIEYMTNKEEILTVDVDGIKFYAIKSKNISNSDEYFTRLYLELGNGDVACFIGFNDIKNVEDLKENIRQRITNKILFIN